MIKINYKEPEELETPDDVALFNIKISDKYKKSDYLELSCISWLKIDSNRNYRDLEQLFRHYNLNSYIIAQSISEIPNGLRIAKPNETKTQTQNQDNLENKLEMDLKIKTDQKELKYIAKIICADPNDSMRELLKHHLSWEDNYNCLEFAGCLMTIEHETNKEEDNKTVQIQGADEIKKILDCKLKLDLEYYTVEESIDFIINDLANKYGKKPEKNICGEVGTNKVWALMINGEIVSPIGWMEKQIDKNEQNEQNEQNVQMELIDFRKVKMKNK